MLRKCHLLILYDDDVLKDNQPVSSSVKENHVRQWSLVLNGTGMAARGPCNRNGTI